MIRPLLLALTWTTWCLAQGPVGILPVGNDDGTTPSTQIRSILFSTIGGVPTSAANRFTITSQHFNDPSFDALDYYATAGADDFTIPGSVLGWEITDVHVAGAYFAPGSQSGTTGVADSVNVYFFDGATLPNPQTPADAGDLGAEALFAFQNISYVDTGDADFSITLPGGIYLTPGTYWIVVQANMSYLQNGQWGWTEASDTPDSGTANGNPSAWLQTPSKIIAGNNAACVNVWNPRNGTCNIGNTSAPPADPDLAFALSGNAIVPGITATLPGGGVIVSESGAVSSFTIALDGAPSANVDVTLTVSDSAAGEISTDAATYASSQVFTFTTANWFVAQTVYVRGKDDGAVAGKTDFNVQFTNISSTDPNYSGLSLPSDVPVTQTDNDTPQVLITQTSGHTTTEAGGTSTFDVSLAVVPTADVMITFTSADLGEARLSTDGVTQMDAVTLTFTNANSTVAQTVTIHGQNDDIDDGNIPFSITAAVTGAAEYDGIAVSDITGTNTDDDTAGVTVTAADPLVTGEPNLTAMFTVVLDSQPTADVTITCFSSDQSEGQVTTGNSLTFTSGNWNVAQNVTVTGQDDNLQDGNIPYFINFNGAASTDPNYSGMSIATLNAVNNDDADTSGFTITAGTINLTEAGSSDMFTVVLDSQPANDVTIPVVSQDTTEGTVDLGTLTFTNANWNTPQTVTITGVDDDIDDGDIAFSVKVGPTSSADGTYDALPFQNVGATTLDNDTAGVTVNPTTATTSETGTTADFTVVLTSEPTADVTIAVTSGDLTEGTVSTASLVFTNANWDTPQTVTITGVNDALDDGNIAYNVTMAATSADSVYNGISVSSVAVTNNDDDTAGVTVTPTSGLVVTEAGGTDSFTVVLASQPTADVTITVTSADTTEGTVSTGSLTFTNANYATPQSVTVTGVNDDIDDGNVAFNITMTAASADGSYNGISVSSVGVTNNDDADTAGVTVTPTSGLSTDETGTTDTFTVVLTSQPTANVTVTVTSGDTTEGTVAPSPLTFTTANWATPQTVTVTGVDDFVVDGDITYNVTLSASSSDGLYNGISISSVSVTNVNDDFCGPVTISVTIGGAIIVTGTGGCVIDLYNTHGSGDPSDWTLLASGVTIPGVGDGQSVTIPGLQGAPDTFYVVTASGTFTILNSTGFPVLTVPTLGEWGLIAFVTLLLAAGMVIMRRQRLA